MIVMSESNELILSDDNKTILGYKPLGSIDALEIPYGIESIEDEVFSSCNANSIILPDSVSKIEIGRAHV